MWLNGEHDYLHINIIYGDSFDSIDSVLVTL